MIIIACPACETRYELPDGAIKAEGRTVRCAKCRHSWFQKAPEPQMAELKAPQGEEADGGLTEDVAAEPDVWDSETEPPADAPGQPAPSAADPEPRKRGRFRLWSWGAVVFLGLAGATAGVASYWGVPDWVPFDRRTFAATQRGLELDFPADQQERRQLPNGTEFFGASGTITNVDSTEQSVPPILIVLRDARDRIVYSWEVEPPKRRLGPGESMNVREAITDIPRSARVAEIGWKPA